VSKKSGKIAELIENCRGRELPAHYLGYFECFNQQLFYEAHDVLEELWLTKRGAPEFDFYKGLIQFAGAFVHLQKNRLRPAVALFRLSQSYLRKYPSEFEHMDVAGVIGLADEWVECIEENDFQVNPLGVHVTPTLNVR
jgi:predicted metal-dependent hydrolase